MDILSFRHKGLERLFTKEDARGLPHAAVAKLGVILTVMAEAERAGEWSVTVTRNWRITFAVEANAIVNVDFEDYH